MTGKGLTSLLTFISLAQLKKLYGLFLNHLPTVRLSSKLPLHKMEKFLINTKLKNLRSFRALGVLKLYRNSPTPMPPPPSHDKSLRRTQ